MTLTDKQREWREDRVRRIPCDICQGPSICCHEFARGCNRQLAITEACCQLVLCDDCHTGAVSVHTGYYSVAEQLAYLHFRRPQEFDLERYYRIIARRWPGENEIWLAYRKLTDIPPDRF